MQRAQGIFLLTDLLQPAPHYVAPKRLRETGETVHNLTHNGAIRAPS
jgi:hypothetical protein